MHHITLFCSSSNLLVAAFTQHLASYPTSAPLPTTSSPLPSPLAVTSHQDQKGLALLLVSIRDALLITYALLPSHLSEDSRHEYFKLYHTHQIILKTLKIFIAEMEFQLRITLAQLVHLTKGASTRPRVPYYSPKQSGLATFLALLLIAVRRPLSTTSALLPGQLLTRLPLEISPLAST